MDLNESTLRSWVLKFYSLSRHEQEKIKTSLSMSERQRLDELLVQIDALGLGINSVIIDEVVDYDLKSKDLSLELLDRLVGNISPFWYVLVSNKLLSDVSLAKKPAYFEEFVRYRKDLKDAVLAPQMQATLDMYFYERVVHEYEK
ncbi:hypothetical protein NDN11_11705 [Acinetobacter sp. C26M]|uniref:hypothetical protein n=1 Tax=unclassified Acinetobacter TaxID=196816 RepID=UPI0020371738|nr:MULTISPECIES: hypothetical protein [unclassified Acinetobacter]USA45387.1 hypothetical protein NDN11_11705 [Acinetobacter sp. C26M]USA48889.1 hypothetical protein NDN12_11705 [Acinetobacter sp. C26G]